MTMSPRQYFLTFYRAMHMHSMDYAITRCLFVRPSVRLSHASIVSQRLNISPGFFIVRLPHRTKLYGSIPTRSQGASNAWCIKKIEIFDQYLALSRK